MNDQRFIELVNLYIDREITAAETAELEIEIQSNSRRRAIYQQYCKLNRATSLVYESFRAQAAEPAKAVAVKSTIAKFEVAKRQRRGAWAYYAGGLAAAACVAFAVVQFNRNPTLGGTDLPQAVAATFSSAPPAVVAPPAVSTSTATESHVQFANLRSEVQADEHYAALLQALRRDQQRGLAETQLKLLETPSLFDDGVFDSKQPGVLNQRVFRSQKPATTPQAEFTAFQFQR